MKSVHSGRIERWLGTEQVEHISKTMKGWYGPPIHLLDCPGSVRVCGDGDFIGPFESGYFSSAMDSLAERIKRASRPRYGVINVGFSSLSDAIAELSGGKRQYIGGGGINKVGTTGVVGVTNSLWAVGAQPAAGAAGSAAPGGRACSSSTAGALVFNNPSGTDTSHLIGADMAASVAANSLLLYDRIFDVAKTMNSSATEAVTGVPTRYQSTTATDQDSARGNFLFVEVGGTPLAATAHNWTTCTYKDQSDVASTLPSLTGNSGAIVNRLDHPAQQWFAPLETGDTGVKALTQMQCSASVATGVINFVIGHPIGVMAFPLANFLFPFDWLTSRDLCPRIFDSACLSLLEITKSATTATTYTGTIQIGQG